MLQTRGGRLLSIEIPSDITFAQRRGWADNTYFTVMTKNFSGFSVDSCVNEDLSLIVDISTDYFGRHQSTDDDWSIQSKRFFPNSSQSTRMCQNYVTTSGQGQGVNSG